MFGHIPNLPHFDSAFNSFEELIDSESNWLRGVMKEKTFEGDQGTPCLNTTGVPCKMGFGVVS
jgi:hypothetical protein